MVYKKTLLVCLLLGLGACSTGSMSEEAMMDKKVKEEPVITSPEQIAKAAAEAFTNAPGLTVDQKQKLMKIYSTTYAEAISIRTEIGQSKSLLFKMIATKDYKSKDVEMLKSKVIALDQRRLNVMFKALADVQEVVGYGSGKEEIYKHFRDYEIPHNRSFASY